MFQILGLLLALILAAVAQKWMGHGSLKSALFLYAVAGGLFVWLAPGPRVWPKLPPRHAWPKQG